MLPLVAATGFGIDYANAARLRTKLNAAADAAALAAVTPSMMLKSDSASYTAAQNMFNAQTSTLSGLTITNLTINVSDSGLTRTAVVSYTALSQNAFATIAGKVSLPISGSSTSTASVPPNIDFYLLLDSSPSMAIAATSAGISTMVSNTASQGGCAFACHETNPSADNLGNPGNEDNYALARSLSVTLRIDMLKTAAQNLMTTAQSYESMSNATYRMAIYTFDIALNTIETLTSNLSNAYSSAGNIQMLKVYSNNFLTQTNNNSDSDTNVDNAFTQIISTMPLPGTGATGSTPQEVLFFVTDGVEDEMVNGQRQQSLINTSWCTAIKNEGIRIAVLYTEYLPLPTNSWYTTYISPFQANIGTTLQSCASPGLYQEVTTDQDISAALAQLFSTAVATARLTH